VPGRCSCSYSPENGRSVAVADLFAGYFETVLAKNELIA
jgi:CO/xanthine dehydrogenase FAD-binding subunit